MTIKFAKYFKKRIAKHTSATQRKFLERVKVFQNNKFHPQLHNHSLIGKYKGSRSINITGDIRAIFKEEGDVVKFEDIGTHSELYG